VEKNAARFDKEKIEALADNLVFLALFMR